MAALQNELSNVVQKIESDMTKIVKEGAKVLFTQDVFRHIQVLTFWLQFQISRLETSSNNDYSHNFCTLNHRE